MFYQVATTRRTGRVVNNTPEVYFPTAYFRSQESAEKFAAEQRGRVDVVSCFVREWPHQIETYHAIQQ
jgi:hypothetical protein